MSEWDKVKVRFKAAPLTTDEWQVLLDAANLYEAEPANFESDRSDRRLKALRSAINKIKNMRGR